MGPPGRRERSPGRLSPRPGESMKKTSEAETVVDQLDRDGIALAGMITRAQAMLRDARGRSRAEANQLFGAALAIHGRAADAAHLAATLSATAETILRSASEEPKKGGSRGEKARRRGIR